MEKHQKAHSPFFVVQKKLLAIRALLLHILCSCFVLFFMDGELPIAFLLNLMGSKVGFTNNVKLTNDLSKYPNRSYKIIIVISLFTDLVLF